MPAGAGLRPVLKVGAMATSLLGPSLVGIENGFGTLARHQRRAATVERRVAPPGCSAGRDQCAEPPGPPNRRDGAEMTTAHRVLRTQAARPRESRPLRVAVEITAPGGGLSYLRSHLPELERQSTSLLVFARAAVAAVLRDALRSPASEVRVVGGRSSVAGLRFIHAWLAVEARRWGAEVLYCVGSPAALRSRRIPTVVCARTAHLIQADARQSLRMAVVRPVAWLSALRASELVRISVSTAAEFACHSALRRSYSIVMSALGQVEQASRPTRGTRRDAIVMVSTLCAYARIGEILAAFAAEWGLHDSHELVIARDELEADLHRRLEDLASALDCAESVRFTGFLTKAESLDLYHRTVVLVSASREEAFPWPPGEALAMAVPAALSEIPPAPQAVQAPGAPRHAQRCSRARPGHVGYHASRVRTGRSGRGPVGYFLVGAQWRGARAHLVAGRHHGPGPRQAKAPGGTTCALPRSVRAVIRRATQVGPGLPSSRDHERTAHPKGDL
jgi:glycosyltransferase involved in cell wall biosynthesis